MLLCLSTLAGPIKALPKTDATSTNPPSDLPLIQFYFLLTLALTEDGGPSGLGGKDVLITLLLVSSLLGILSLVFFSIFFQINVFLGI